MTIRSSNHTSVSSSIIHDIQQENMPSYQTDSNFFSPGVERMKMIPSPSQAMTILRALNIVDLRNYDLNALEILLPLLKELLSGKISIYKNLPDKTFIQLNNIVHDALEKTSMGQKSKTINYDNDTENKSNNDVLVGQEHLLTVLRAINSIDINKLDPKAKNRMKRVKQLIFSLSLGQKSTIEQLLKSDNKEDKICAKIIRNALIMAHDENSHKNI